MKSLLIYIPTFGRSERASKQTQDLAKQVQDMNQLSGINVHIHIRVNADMKYRRSQFSYPNCTLDYAEFNEGADSNIAYGFFYAKKNHFDYLWIVGDDEVLSNGAINNIASIISAKPYVDAIVGSKNYLGSYSNPKSLLKMNEELGRTLSFITSTIYKVNFDLSLCETSFLFSYTSYAHMAMQHNLVFLKLWKKVEAIDIQLLCNYHKKVLDDPLKPRGDFEVRDSRVFFGKPLSALATGDKKYIDGEFFFWWKLHWHRVSMYLNKREPNGLAFLGYSLSNAKNLVWILPSLLPFWRLKDILKPIRTSRDDSWIS